MTEQKLRLVKNRNGHIEYRDPEEKRAYEKPQLRPRATPLSDQATHASGSGSSAPEAETDSLTPAEAEEVARFKALVAAKAARQAMLRQIMAELDELDDIPPAA